MGERYRKREQEVQEENNKLFDISKKNWKQEIIKDRNDKNTSEIDIEYLERCQRGEEVGAFGGGDLKYSEKISKRQELECVSEEREVQLQEFLTYTCLVHTLYWATSSWGAYAAYLDPLFYRLLYHNFCPPYPPPCHHYCLHHQHYYYHPHPNFLIIVIILALCRDVSALAEYSPEVAALVLQKWNGKHTWYLSQESLHLVLASRCRTILPLSSSSSSS